MLRLAFEVYDFDADGRLGLADLTMLLKTLLPEDAEEDLIHYAATMTISEADADGDGALSYSEYRNALANSDLRARLTINF